MARNVNPSDPADPRSPSGEFHRSLEDVLHRVRPMIIRAGTDMPRATVSAAKKRVQRLRQTCISGNLLCAACPRSHCRANCPELRFGKLVSNVRVVAEDQAIKAALLKRG